MAWGKLVFDSDWVCFLDQIVKDDDGQALNAAKISVVGDEEGTVGLQGCCRMEGVCRFQPHLGT